MNPFSDFKDAKSYIKLHFLPPLFSQKKYSDNRQITFKDGLKSRDPSVSFDVFTFNITLLYLYII